MLSRDYLTFEIKRNFKNIESHINQLLLSKVSSGFFVSNQFESSITKSKKSSSEDFDKAIAKKYDAACSLEDLLMGYRKVVTNFNVKLKNLVVNNANEVKKITQSLQRFIKDDPLAREIAKSFSTTHISKNEWYFQVLLACKKRAKQDPVYANSRIDELIADIKIISQYNRAKINIDILSSMAQEILGDITETEERIKERHNPQLKKIREQIFHYRNNKPMQDFLLALSQENNLDNPAINSILNTLHVLSRYKQNKDIKGLIAIIGDPDQEFSEKTKLAFLNVRFDVNPLKCLKQIYVDAFGAPAWKEVSKTSLMVRRIFRAMQSVALMEDNKDNLPLLKEQHQFLESIDQAKFPPVLKEHIRAVQHLYREAMSHSSVDLEFKEDSEILRSSPKGR